MFRYYCMKEKPSLKNIPPKVFVKRIVSYNERFDFQDDETGELIFGAYGFFDTGVKVDAEEIKKCNLHEVEYQRKV